MSWIDDPVALVAAWPAFALPLFVFASAALEYVFPPYWGDMFVLLGFFLSGQGASSPWLIFAAAFTGSVVGSAVAFLLGRRYGLSIVRRVAFWRPTGTRERIRRLLLRFGERFLVVNRFVPFLRGFLLYGAGGLKLRFGPAVGYSALSNFLWLTILMGVGLLTAGTWEQILAKFQHTNRLLGVAASVVVVAWILFLVLRSRSQQDPAV